MAIIKVLAGDLRKGQQRINPKWVKSAELQTEEKLKKLSGSVGWGFAGAVVGGLMTGGIGLAVGGLAGILSGGNKTEVCFSCELEDSRKFLAVTDNQTWQKILAVIFEKNQAQPNQTQIISESVNKAQIEKEPVENKNNVEQDKNDPGSLLTLDAEINEVRQSLELTLAEYGVTVQVNQAGKQLTIVVNRKAEVLVEYPKLAEIVEHELNAFKTNGFKFNGVRYFKLIGRISGATQPEWQKIISSNSDSDVSLTSNEFFNKASKVNSKEKTWSEIRNNTILILSRFWKWYISGFASRPDKALYESPRFWIILFTFFILGNFLGFLDNILPDTSVRSTSSLSPSSNQVTDEEITDKEFCTLLIDETVDKASTLKGKEAKEYFKKVQKLLTTKVHGRMIATTCIVSGVEKYKLDQLTSALEVLKSNF